MVGGGGEQTPGFGARGDGVERPRDDRQVIGAVHPRGRRRLVHGDPVGRSTSDGGRRSGSKGGGLGTVPIPGRLGASANHSLKYHECTVETVPRFKAWTRACSVIALVA
ncbi:unnamed protein product [Ectocarpus sp. 12 AP-2014]